MFLSEKQLKLQEHTDVFPNHLLFHKFVSL